MYLFECTNCDIHLRFSFQINYKLSSCTCNMHHWYPSCLGYCKSSFLGDTASVNFPNNLN